MWAGARAYNRWLAEVFDPVRQVGLTLIPTLTDIDEVIRELEWGASAGFRGAYIRQLEEGLPLLSDRRYEPMWNACARLGLIVHFHGGVGTPLEPPIETIDGRELPTPSIETAWWGYRPIWHLMFAGVFDRNPELQVVISEVHASWAPNVVDTMDVRWEDIWLQFHDMLPEPPSFYWRRQCSIGASFLSRAEAQQRDLIGADRIMYGNDYPHVEGIWPQTRHFLHESLCGLPEADARMLAGENAVRLYGLDRRALEAIAERVGPPIEEVLGGEPAPPSAYPTDRMAARAARPASWVLGGAHRKLTL
jgi:predicted TIM-barrel fold metal-dependent hydrolase